MEVQNGAYIKIEFRGPTNTRGACYYVSWRDHANDSKPIRKRIAYDHEKREGGATENAIAAFMEWKNETGADLGWTFEVTHVASAYVSGEETALIVSTRIANPEGIA